MKVVMDTNVIVAAFATRGICAEVFENRNRHPKRILGDIKGLK